MNFSDNIAVCSRSFSKNPILRKEILQRFKNVTFNDSGRSLKGNSLIKFLKGHNKAITALEVIDEAILSELPDLKLISKYGVGLDMIDLEAMKRHGKDLSWSGGVNRRSVSELVISFAISMLRHIPEAQKEVLSNSWRQHIGRNLSGKTVGIIGCGYIGKDLVKMLQPFNCRILVNDILDFPDFYKIYDVEAVNLSELLSLADVVTLHVPLDNTTRNILSADRLNMMKPNAILINAARGGLIDEKELKAMLIDKRLYAAALDVFAIEPPTDFDLLELPNFLVTPHIGGSSIEAILAMGRAAINGLDFE